MPQVGAGLNVRVTGVGRTVRRLAMMNSRIKAAVNHVIRTYTLRIFAEATRRAPGDTGRLQGSVEFFIRNLLGKVAATANYAAFVEFGTGPLGAQTNTQDLPEGYRHGSSHGFPPPNALEGWANRHSANEYMVAQAIFKRGGNPAQPFLGPAYEQFIDGFRLNLRRVVKTATGDLSIG